MHQKTRTPICDPSQRQPIDASFIALHAGSRRKDAKAIKLHREGWQKFVGLEVRWCYVAVNDLWICCIVVFVHTSQILQVCVQYTVHRSKPIRVYSSQHDFLAFDRLIAYSLNILIINHYIIFNVSCNLHLKAMANGGSTALQEICNMNCKMAGLMGAAAGGAAGHVAEKKMKEKSEDCAGLLGIGRKSSYGT